MVSFEGGPTGFLSGLPLNPEMPAKNLLLTGYPGVGKTTLVMRVAEALRDWRLAGFYTSELRAASGLRLGFEVITFGGERAVLAHVDRRTGPRVGRYRVDLAAFERVALPAIRPTGEADLVIIDEIGRMECFSDTFQASVLSLLNGPVPILATVAYRGVPFAEGLKARSDVEVTLVTPANRDTLVAEVLQRLQLLHHQ